MCDIDASCTNTDGNYTCQCNPGFTGNGIICMGIIISFQGHLHSKSSHYLQMWMSVKKILVYVLRCVSTRRGVMSVHVTLAMCGMEHSAVVYA